MSLEVRSRILAASSFHFRLECDTGNISQVNRYGIVSHELYRRKASVDST